MSRIDEDAITTQEGPPGSPPAPEPPERKQPILRVDEARRRSLRPWAIAGGCLICVAVAGAGLTSTPLFHAKSIAIEGERHFSERQVLRIAGIDHDTNVFRLDEGAVRRRLERDPWIANAIVSTDLPSTISISVLERVPVAVALTEDGRQLIAADGTPLGVAAAGSALPEVRLVGEPGQPGPAFDAVAAGAGVAGGMPPAIRLQVELVVIGSDGIITLHLTDGVTVTYGGPDEFEAKARSDRGDPGLRRRPGESADVDRRHRPSRTHRPLRGVDRAGDTFGGDTRGEPDAHAEPPDADPTP